MRENRNRSPLKRGPCNYLRSLLMRSLGLKTIKAVAGYYVDVSGEW